MRKNLILVVLIFASLFLISLGFVSAQSSPTVCCEKTSGTPANPDGMFCQDVSVDECAPGVKQIPTACASTSYCKPGFCYDSNEGTCPDNTPLLVCNISKGHWTEKMPASCELGCCILGDQWSLVTLVRCKSLSGNYGFETNFKKNIKDEVSCSDLVRSQEKGACVFEFEFQKTCRITARAECAGGISGNLTKGTFFKGMLCSAEELETICGPKKEVTTCIEGKEDVYFRDSCGNPANIYDSTKYNDDSYWTYMKDEKDSCYPNSANINSASCGNCNYPLGSICRTDKKGSSKCVDLNCYGSESILGEGKTRRLHGESWCIYSDEGSGESPNNAVGSQFYKYICENGEVSVEACADFRNQICVESSMNYTAGATSGTFLEAQCKVNRWQDCTLQGSKNSCRNTDMRDCVWAGGKCVPRVAPGLKFWERSDAKAICSQASTECATKGEKKVGGGYKWKGECVDEDGDIIKGWLDSKKDICKSLGDCGYKINWLGASGSTSGYELKRV